MVDQHALHPQLAYLWWRPGEERTRLPKCRGGVCAINGSVYLSIDLSSNTSINLCLYVRVLLSVSLLVPLKESAERRNQANQANQSLPSFSMSFESLLISSSVALSFLASSSFSLVPSTTLLTHATSVLSRSFVLGQ